MIVPAVRTGWSGSMPPKVFPPRKQYRIHIFPSGPGTTMGSKDPVSSPGRVIGSHVTPPSRLRKAALRRSDRPVVDGVRKVCPPDWVTAIRKSGLSGLAAIQGSLNSPGPTRRLGPTATAVSVCATAGNAAAKITARATTVAQGPEVLLECVFCLIVARLLT